MTALGTDPATPPNAPDGLGDQGLALWDATVARYSLRWADEVRLLEQACRVLDWIARLDAELADGDLLVKGSMGQPATNPLLGELRGLRTQFASLMKHLSLPDEAGPVGTPTKSPRHVAAAQARWSRRDAAVASAHQRAEDGAL